MHKYNQSHRLRKIPELMRLPLELEDIIIDYVSDLEVVEQTTKNFKNLMKDLKTIKITNEGTFKVIGYRITPKRNLKKPIYSHMLHKTFLKCINSITFFKINAYGQWTKQVMCVI